MPEPRTDLLRALPQVEELMQAAPMKALEAIVPRSMLVDRARAAVDGQRQLILAGTVDAVDVEAILTDAVNGALATLRPSLRRVINATGVIIHTNLGRSVLAEPAVQAVVEAARGYSTLEYSIENMARGSRHDHVEHLICALTGAEAAIAVNNNAAAVMMVLAEFAAGHEAIVSRGELVEIGGSFRIPEIVTQCGCTLCEVGATNKTHRRDYEAAIGEQTRALLKVHTSNYRIVGFTESVPREELAEIAHGHGLPLIEDLGSGAIVDLEPFGIRGEPTVQRSLHAGVDVASFSGDKLLGGPQAGLIVGRREYIERIKKHPLARALRLDKMTLAALHATLSAYLDAEIAVREIPTLAMLSASEDKLHAKALRLQKLLADTGVSSQLVRTGDAVGGGSAPAQELTDWAVAIEPGRLSVDELEEKLRLRAKPIVARIHRRQYLLCVRTIREEDFAEIAAAAAEAIR